MYNGIGLTTPRGSGTNGHVQRNWAFLRPGKKDNSNYRSEEDIKKLDVTLNRPPNKDILDHDRKRKIEVKCLEFEEILEKQGLSSNEIKAKVDSYRKKLMGQGKLETPKDEFGRIAVRDSHQIAEAQQVKNAKLREAFNISEYFVEGSSFDSDRRSKEDLAKSLALQKELDNQRDQETVATAKEKESSKRYALVRTPSMEQDASLGGVGDVADGDNTIKRKKKKKTRENSTSPDRKKDKKKKSKKHKKESKQKKSRKLRKRRGSESDSKSDNGKDRFNEDSETEIEVKKNRKKNRKDKKQRRNKKKEISSSSDKSRSNSPLDKPIEYKKSETLKESKSSDYHFRSRSKDKSQKPKEAQRHRCESSQDSLNRRNRSDRNKTRLRSNSHNDKHLSSRRSRSIEKNDRCRVDLRDSYLKRSSKARYCHSHESNIAHGIKDHENRRSRSRQKSKGEITVERVKNLKRKNSEEHLQRIREIPSVDKRKQCLKTPGYQSLNNQKKVKKSRSRSASVKANLRQKSLTPPPRTSNTVESEKYNTNTQKKLAIFNLKNKKPVVKKSRSRTNSRSVSNEASSTDTETSKSMTPSPKKEHKEKPLISNKNIDTQKPIGEKQRSQSPIRTATPVKLGSTSRSKCLVLNENSRIDKQRSASKSKEWLAKSKDKREDHKKLSSRTPPPFKAEKKVLSPRSSRNSSELSYSPARRNPERYRDILENPKNEKNEKNNIFDKDEERNKLFILSKQSEERECDRKEKASKSDRNQAKPVVRLQSQSDEDSDFTERNTEKILDEFQESRRERELKELKMLEQLKTGIAAKAKEKIKTIEKMAASTSTSILSSNDGEVSGKPFKRRVRHSLNDFLAANKVAPAMLATSSPTNSNSISKSPPGAIYPQTLDEIKKEQESVLQLTEISINIENYKNSNKDNEAQANCKNPLVSANGHALLLSPTTNSLMNKDRDFKRERDFRERETNNFNKDRYLERRQKSSPILYSAGTGGGSTVGGGVMVGGRRNNNSIMLNINHRQQRLNLMCNAGGVGAHLRHPHLHHMHPHHHHPIHKIINNHHSTNSSCTTTYIANNSSTNPHTFMCNHANNSTNISFNRPSRINNTPLITATQFNNQMLSKQSNSILVNRRDHRTALNLGLSGTPCTNFSNSNLLLTKANSNTNHIHGAAVGHVVSGGHHHHHHHHHHHGQSASLSSGVSNPATQITDRILMAASIAAAQRHSLGVVHSAAPSVAAVAAANNLNYLQQQNKPKLVIKPFKINDSQPLVAALADSSLVDAIVSKVSTATVAAAESAARRSRSRSRRSRSRNRHDEKASCGGNSSGGGNVDLVGSRRRSTSHSRSSRSSTSSRSRSRSHSHRSSRSHSSQSSVSSHTSSRSSSSCGSSRSGTRSPSIPRRRGSPSFLDRRRITSARKRPIPYHRKLPSDVSSCYCSSCCSRDSSTRSRSPSRDSRSPSRFF